MKIIAIRPLENCHPEYIKLLSTDTLYFLLNNFEIDAEDKITERTSLPMHFFSTQKTQINIQAIVGKNGSGKSTLIELLFRVINNIAFDYQKIKIADIQKLKNLKVELYFETDTFYKVKIVDDKISFFKYDGRSKKINIPIKHEAIDLKDFFYSIVVNYSHYAYNASDNDKWLDGLFHKNDGYRTPLVLNPFRKQGNIDINSENHLVKSRFITNLLLPIPDNHFRSISKNLYASDLELKVNKNISNKPYKELYRLNDKTSITMREIILDKDNLLRKLDRYFKFGYKNLDLNKYQIAIDYVIYKLVSIALKYYNHEDDYFLKEEKKFNNSKIEQFFKEIYEDSSHITLKLRQTINFLKFKHIELKDQIISLENLSKINNDILKRKTIKAESIELLPPPIFTVEVGLASVNNKKKRVSFKTLSSGEKQMIYSVSSILYHILNLESVPSNTQKRTAYRYINVVLEEIEMYAHPEMQRTYIDYIIKSIEKLSLKRTLGINICFITHSPFILSDIPESNILFLNEVGLPEPLAEKLKTFGGNIHDLLGQSFFLTEGAVGAFALNKIDQTIKTLKEKNMENSTDDERNEILENINIIGEPFLRNKLLDMYYLKFEKQKRIDELEAELQKLKSNG
ncbi:AAA family ATPase [Flavobacterium sp. HSC-61S13]|uniref:AAA family ATPase n=1 Tax=Flavobacterium sp. HSC-61S13 TaxID=2910963 RepID=UPI0020A11F82|nr:AAA family ATPase [Flavobacterium sp. HSC-61S13]MCP1996113.1 energy-coupling factor transporter ATP-binding protein EcfA2 [Flavobacterium sp. HSC-61S13]